MFSSVHWNDFSAALGEVIAEEQGAEKESNAKEKEAENPKLSSLYSRQQTRYEKAKVNPGDRSISRGLKGLGNNLASAAQDVAATAMSAGAITYATSALSPGSDSTNSSGHIAQAATTSLTAAVTTLVRSSVDTVVHGSKLTELGAEQETFWKFKRSTSPEMLKAYPEYIKTDVDQLDQRVENAIKAGNTDVAFFKQQNRHRELVLLARPLEAKDLTHNGDKGKVEKVMRDLDFLFKDLEDPAAFKSLAMRIIMNSMAENPTRVQAYFDGPGGVGKSYIIQTMAEMIGAPFVYVRVSEERYKSGVKQMLGTEWPIEYSPATEPEEKTIGSLQMSMIRAGYTNPVIFIDELKADAQNINDLKVLLDPAKRSLKLGGYQSQLDWSRATVIVASNDKLNDEPLQTRMLLMHLSKASDSVKRTVVSARVQSEVSNYQFMLSDKQRSNLLGRCNSKVDELIAVDNKTFPGARYIDAAASMLVNYIAAGVMERKPRTNKQITDFINKRYENFSQFKAAQEAERNAE